MQCPHCGAKDMPHIAAAAVARTRPEEKVLYCFKCQKKSSYAEWLQEEIAQGKTKVIMKADIRAGAVTPKLIELELAVHRREDGTLDYIEIERSGIRA